MATARLLQAERASLPDQGTRDLFLGSTLLPGGTFSKPRTLHLHCLVFNIHCHPICGCRRRLLGNSVSTFASLAMLERRHRGLWAGYYNGGNVPLASMLPPLARMPWVFTYNSWSPHYDYLLRGAVR